MQPKARFVGFFRAVTVRFVECVLPFHSSFFVEKHLVWMYSGKNVTRKSLVELEK